MKLGNSKVLFVVSMLAAVLLLAATAAAEPQDPPSSEDGAVVIKTSEPAKVTRPRKLSASTVLTRPLQPAPDLEVCRLPAMAVEILDPASGRAVIREGSHPPRVVKSDSVLAGSTAVVREIGLDKLVAEVEGSGDGPRPVLWIFAAEETGERSRVQCFVAATPPQPAARAGTAEPGSRR